MKKTFLAIFCTATLLSNYSYATGIFIGVDALQVNARHKADNPSGSLIGPKDGDVIDIDKSTWGANSGVRFDFLNLLASVEGFYDRLDTYSNNFYSTLGTRSNGDNIQFKDRYGVKANLGFAILPRITPFLTLGAAKVNYQNNVFSMNNSVHDSEVAPLYGVGILFDLPLGITLKAAYDYQQFNMRYAESGSKIKNHLGVARLGVIYNF
jgi:hypothetical protein